MLKKASIAATALAVLIAGAGCQEIADRAKEAREMTRRQPVKTEAPKPQPQLAKTEAPAARVDEEPLPEIAASGFLYDPSAVGLAAQRGGVDEQVAVARVTAYIRDAVELDPTLVVWLIDRSHSASKVVFQAGRHIDAFYTGIAQGREPKIQPRDAEPRLLTAVVSFGKDVQIPLETPSSDAQAVIQALDSISVDQDPHETPFAAVAAAVEKFLPQCNQQGRRMLLVIVTDEAGDDAARVDEVLAEPRKYGVPVYAIGSPAPFGRVSALPAVGEGAASEPAKDDGPALKHGPESLALERVELPSFIGVWKSVIMDSGFGPFALERLCRGTGGEFIALEPPSKPEPGAALADWPSPLAVRFEREAMRRYAPDYVSPAAYQKLLDENAARMALHQAAEIDGQQGSFYPETDFAKESEAQLQMSVSKAQQLSAKMSPPVDRIYELLQQGEAARPALTEPRWQAGYDLALGRAAAAKARIDGYNAMLAMLKRGRKFERAESTGWTLQPDDATEAGTAIERLITKAKTNLERVVQDHPGTPWAHLAKQELEAKFGWRWEER